jgi:hypothetical protein
VILVKSSRIVYLIDKRYPHVDEVGDVVRAVVPLNFEPRTSDYLGGDYLLYEGSDCVVRIMKNYSSFLDDWYIEGEAGLNSEYVMVVEKCRQPSMFDVLLNLPGFSRYVEPQKQ